MKMTVGNQGPVRIRAVKKFLLLLFLLLFFFWGGGGGGGGVSQDHWPGKNFWEFSGQHWPGNIILFFVVMFVFVLFVCRVVFVVVFVVLFFLGGGGGLRTTLVWEYWTTFDICRTYFTIPVQS